MVKLLNRNILYFDFSIYRNPSFATSFIAFSGVISSKFTLEPLYMPLMPSFFSVLTKQSPL